VREQFGARGTLSRLARVAEAAFTERRAGRAGDDETGGPDARGVEEDKEPAREFARQLAVYKRSRGADG
jgi:hypothetical protein